MEIDVFVLADGKICKVIAKDVQAGEALIEPGHRWVKWYDLEMVSYSKPPSDNSPTK